MTVGLYIHIPFCHVRCGYCDFATTTGQEDKLDAYLARLDAEMARHAGRAVDTIFVGGGTPTVLSPEQINRLFNSVRAHFDVTPLREATVEANPESATPDRLAAFRDAGINRLSFGLQSTQNPLLERLDRPHTWEDFCRVYQLARTLGFSHINVDLIFGLPGQTRQDWADTLSTVHDLNPEHISVYALKVEPGTRFDRDQVQVDDDLQADMYLDASRFLTHQGYDHYEISNFAKPSYECQHNLKYWTNQPTLGVGVSAASFLNNTRQTNTRNLHHYLDGSAPPTVVCLGETDRFKEEIMLGLRLNKGVRSDWIQDLSIPTFQTFLNQGLAHIYKEQYQLTPQGWLVSNQLFSHLV